MSGASILLRVAAVRAADVDRLKHVLTVFLEVPEIVPATLLVPEILWTDSAVYRALAGAGVERFNNDFIGLNEDDIKSLRVPAVAGGPPTG